MLQRLLFDDEEIAAPAFEQGHRQIEVDARTELDRRQVRIQLVEPRPAVADFVQ